MAKTGRNEPCPCGSGKKYKHCHGAETSAAAQAQDAPAESYGNAMAMQSAIQLHRAGRVGEAAALYRQILARDPQHAEATHLLGLTSLQSGDAARALELIGKALAATPANPTMHNNFAEALSAQGRIEEAISHYEQALAIVPEYADALNNLGVAYTRDGRLEDAERVLRKAVAHTPESVNALNNLGNALQETGRASEAIEMFRRALAIAPNDAEVHSNLGNAQRDTGDLTAAVASYRRALALRPNYAQAANNLGTALQRMGKLDEASSAYVRASAIDPSFADPRSSRAFVLHMQGRLGEAWDEYEFRFLRRVGAVEARNFLPPLWRGEDLRGKTLLIWGEQGVGDELWAAGMFGEMQDGVGDGGRLVLECLSKTTHLLQRSFPRAEVVARVLSSELAARTDFDYQIAAGSLGKYLRPTLASFPGRRAYLVANEYRETYWKEKLSSLGPGLKVGVAWRSSNIKGDRALQCTKLTQWGEVLRVPGVQFINLQYDECEAELAAAEAAFGVRIRRYPEVDMFDDLDETAALMRGLDLVIGAPTSVTILSAALGVPTWQMNYGAEWQCHGLPDNPWYPAMRNYARQWDKPWEEILARIAQDLRALADAPGRGG